MRPKGEPQQGFQHPSPTYEAPPSPLIRSFGAHGEYPPKSGVREHKVGSSSVLDGTGRPWDPLNSMVFTDQEPL